MISRSPSIEIAEILNFWFQELKPANWFAKDEHVDAIIRDRFLDLHFRAQNCELFNWRCTPEGSDCDRKIELSRRAFFYMPYMHSESLTIHQVAVKLFSQKGLEDNYKFEVLHKKIIEKFGRYSFRNDALKRKSSKEESEYLKNNSRF